jgi:hypothetical protein
MTRLDLRVCSLARALRRFSVARLNDKQLTTLKGLDLGHNPAVDLAEASARRLCPLSGRKSSRWSAEGLRPVE